MTGTMKSINPYTGDINRVVDVMTDGQVDEAVRDARKRFERWRLVPLHQRLDYMRSTADVLRNNAQHYAELMTMEMGKPIREALAEVEKCAWLCDYYVEHAEAFLHPEEIDTGAQKSYVRYDPLGIVLAIMPWNFPMWQVFRAAVPAIVSGNVCMLKHASNVPLCALAIEEIFRKGGLPIHTFTTLLVPPAGAMRLVKNDMVDAISLTGSTAAGMKVGEIAGANLKPMVLELGGSDPFIVLEDADIEKAAHMAIASRMINAGQSCIAAKRFIVMRPVAEAFRDALVTRLEALKVGDPMDLQTDIGPVAGKSFMKELNEQLEDARKRGGEIYQPHSWDDRGYFVLPALVANTTPDMRVVQQEVFGPIAAMIVVDTLEEALQQANATEFGLGAALWTRDLELAEKLAASIDSGFVAINDMVKSDPRLPFGGIKKSGVGRELSHWGLHEFVNIKTVVVQEG